MKLACCGLDCEKCEAFIATKNNDDNLRTKTARDWSSRYNHPFKAHDIECVGCRSEGPHIGHCGVCQIRLCAIEQNVSDCGQCPQFACAKIEGFFKMFPDGGDDNRKRLRRQ